MNDSPLVSVVIIFLNEERFLQEAIDSVLAQSYSSWELFLVDDGSDDASSSIAVQNAELHPGKVFYLEHPSHENLGMSASRNLGISYAKGIYVAFLDADDVWLPEKLKRQIAVFESHPEAAMVYGRALWWYGWTGDPDDAQRDRATIQLGANPDTLVMPPVLLNSYIRDRGIPSPSSVLVRRDAIERVGGFENAFRDNYEDAVFYTKVCSREPVFVSDEIWYRYRQHADSYNAYMTQNDVYHSTRLIFLNWLGKYLSSQFFEDRETWRTLRKELWPYRHPLLAGLISRLLLVKRPVRLLRSIGRMALSYIGLR